MTRHRNGGVRKICECARKKWPTCSHGWHVNFRYKGNGYRFSLDREIGRHIDSKTEAEAEADRLRTAIRDGSFRSKLEPSSAPGPATSVSPNVETLEQYGRDWLQIAAANLKASTVHFYTDNLENHIFPLLGEQPIGAISRKNCRQLVMTTREKRLSITTVRGVARTLSAVLSQAVEDEHLPANPALRLGKYLRRGDEPQPEIDPFTRAEASYLVEVAREHFPSGHPWVLCALRTGLRLGELLALQWGDIDWRRRFIQVQRNLVRGKITTPKNHQRRRVDISRQLRATLRLWRRRKSAEWLKVGQPCPAWVFPSTVGTALDESNVRKAWGEILEKIPDLRYRRIHDMRHTFASLLIQHGESLAYVKEQMGHASIQITVDIYGHLVPGGNRAAVDRLDDPSEKFASRLQAPARLLLRQSA